MRKDTSGSDVVRSTPEDLARGVINAGAPKHAITALRVLALLGFLLAVYLARQHGAQADLPGCQDCDGVITSEWGTVIGVPVSVPAALAYLGALVMLLPGRVWLGEQRRFRVLATLGVTFVAAAMWFLFVQTQLGRYCAYCILEHGVGVAFAAVAWWSARRAGALESTRMDTGVTAGLMPVAMLIVAQHLLPPTYARVAAPEPAAEPARPAPPPPSQPPPAQPFDVAGQPPPPPTGPVEKPYGGDYEGPYSEPDDGHIVALQGGRVKLSPSLHLVHGSPTARRILVEVADYTCPRCAATHKVLTDARRSLGPDYALLVLPFPLSHRCNKVLPFTDPKHEHSCAFARFAQAVWLTSAPRFAEYHDWLFDNQTRIGEAEARAKAAELVGAAALEATLATGKPDELLQREVGIGMKLAAVVGGRLPDLYAGKLRFDIIPEEPSKMAELLRSGFEGGERAGGARSP